MKTEPTKYRWECHWDHGTGQDRECCNCRGHWTENLEKAVAGAKLHNHTHPWAGWGYPSLGWRNQTVNVMQRRKNARNKDLRDGNAVAVPYNEL
jgi:hypothetical protein